MISREPKGKGARRQHVSPGSFFSTDAEKTKLNWFLFEFARELQSFISRERRLKAALRRKGVTDTQIGEFCTHYSKQMKQQILDRVAGRTANVQLGYEEIEAFFPDLGDPLIDRLLTVAAKAWDSHTEACVVCPTRCISEKEQRAPMFDDPYYWE